MKRILRLDRLRLRGPNGATDEFLLTATAQNLRRLVKFIPMPTSTTAGKRFVRVHRCIGRCVADPQLLSVLFNGNRAKASVRCIAVIRP